MDALAQKVNADPSTVSVLVEEVSVCVFSMCCAYCFSVTSTLYGLVVLLQMQRRRWSDAMIATAAESAQVRSSWADVAADVVKVYGRSSAVAINEASVCNYMCVCASSLTL